MRKKNINLNKKTKQETKAKPKSSNLKWQLLWKKGLV